MDVLDNKYQIEQLLGHADGDHGVALYLKTRQAGGESLRDASDQFDALDIPRSKWQARMKSRWTNTHSPTSNR